MKKSTLIFLSMFLMSGCSGGGTSDSPTTPIIDDEGNSGSQVGGDMENPGPQPDPPKEPGLPVKTEATYQLTFTSKWNSRDHLSLPNNAHFSPIVLTVHRARYRMFPIGERASSGFERVAETGNASSLNSEIRDQISRGRVLSSLNTNDMFLRNESSQTFKFTVTKDRPLVSFVTMIAPSPDWVVGLDSLNLVEEGLFIETFTKRLFAYDAGTEEGDQGGNFSTNNSATNPKEFINRLRGRGFDEPFAEVELRLLD